MVAPLLPAASFAGYTRVVASTGCLGLVAS